MTLGSRLKILRKKLNKSQREFATILDISQAAYCNYEKDERNMPSDLLSKIIIAFRLNSDWLINGTGDMLITPENIEKMFCEANDNNDAVKIERIHIKPSCGNGTIVLDEAEVTPILLGTKLIQNIFKIQDAHSLKVFQANGDSMEPTIYDGDDVLVDVSRKDYINGGVFIIERLGDWFIKRLRLKFDGSLEIISDNSSKYGIEVVKQTDGININIKGRVIKNLSRGL